MQRHHLPHCTEFKRGHGHSRSARFLSGGAARCAQGGLGSASHQNRHAGNPGTVRGGGKTFERNPRRKGRKEGLDCCRSGHDQHVGLQITGRRRRQRHDRAHFPVCRHYYTQQIRGRSSAQPEIEDAKGHRRGRPGIVEHGMSFRSSQGWAHAVGRIVVVGLGLDVRIVVVAVRSPEHARIRPGLFAFLRSGPNGWRRETVRHFFRFDKDERRVDAFCSMGHVPHPRDGMHTVVGNRFGPSTWRREPRRVQRRGRGSHECHRNRGCMLFGKGICLGRHSEGSPAGIRSGTRRAHRISFLVGKFPYDCGRSH
mmetsp:Transcript_16074/g.44462  ORF Transcript_16074/g.44462 Transcript_16074/m.44462 type:complete len:311 (-) Transcript_16074:2473-3405(-)